LEAFSKSYCAIGRQKKLHDIRRIFKADIMKSSQKLAGKVAIVTGAGSSSSGMGTGRAISLLFAREGAKVVLVDICEDRARETLDMISGEGGEAAIVQADLSDIASIAPMMSNCLSQFGGADILVNNAALPSPYGLIETSVEFLQKSIAVNLAAPFVLCKEVIPMMIERGGGSIINITSIASLRGQGGNGCPAYAAAKAGMNGLMIDVADSFGRSGIRINCIAPGMIDTPMRDGTIRLAGLDKSTLNLGERTCLGIEGDAWDIARAALFLAGPDGRFITGVHLPVDGGSVSRSH
jgi:NAD(P)-dependent dehydrogenase (short-subunit alcohol dehydrogenase family)